MNALTVATAALTMTTREIAELTGKEHFHVLRDVRTMLAELGLGEGGYIQMWIHPQNGQAYEMFALPKDLTITLIAGYSTVMRHRIVVRWQELEAAAPVRPPQVPQTMAQALRLAAEQAEQIEQQQAQLEAARPAIEFREKYVQADGLKGFREVCKILKANEARFRDFLVDSKIMYRLAGTLTAHQNHIDAGRFEVRTGVADATQHAFTTTKFTPKGIDWVAGEWARYQLKNQQAA
jgi:phage antirepressor YoqD-like protein